LSSATSRPGAVCGAGGNWKREKLLIWGNDYDTPNGTGIRDFIHVVDPASGHLSALSHLKQSGALTVNLGTGAGLLEAVHTFEVVSGRSCNRRKQGR
jgi:UDP-glucose 4-epimerase